VTASEQARADAMADAETLRKNLPTAKWESLCKSVSIALHSVLNAADDAATLTTFSARAAFRACPGLRGAP
jgi:hypothetical protein